MGEEEIAMAEVVTGEVAGAETVRLSEQRPGDWLSLENGRCGAVKVVGNVVQGSGVDSHPALARGCLPAGVRCAWRVTLLSDDDYYVGVATSGVPIHSWLGGLADVRSVYLSKSRTCAIVGKGLFGQGFAPGLRKGGSICFYYDGQHSLIAICRDAAGMGVGERRFQLGDGPYFIALAGNLQLGEDVVHYGASFTRVRTIGCSASYDVAFAPHTSEGPVSIWRPDIAAPYVFFGDSAVRGESAPRHCHVTMRDEVDTVPPVGFRRVVGGRERAGGGAVYIWEPVPPSPDYVALGDVATLSAQEPDPARDFPRLRCVARRLTQVTPLGAYHFHCRAPPGRLGLAFKDATRVVVRVNATSALCGTVREGDELVLVNDCVVTDDDVLGILAAQDDGATARTLVFSRASGRRPKDYYACYAPPGKLGIAFENDARRIVRTLVKGHGNPTGDDRYEPGFVVGRVNPTSALRGVVAVGDALVTVNEVPCCGRDVGPLLALAQPGGRRLLFARKGFRLAPTQDHDWESCGAICCLVCCCRGNKTCHPSQGDGGDYSVSY